VQVSTIRYVYASSASLSLLGCIFILFTCSLNRRDSFLMRLVFCLAVSDFGFSLSSLLVFALPLEVSEEAFSQTAKFICKTQAAGIQYFQMSSFFWTGCIAWHACCAFVFKMDKEQLSQNFKYYVIFCWIVPAIPVAILLFHLDAFGVTDSSWCWIVLDKASWRFYLFWGPVFVVWIFNCVCYYLVKKKFREVMSFLEQAASRRITAYILAFIVVISLPLTNRIVQQFIAPQFILVVLHAAFDPLLGFCNAIVYGWNKQLRQILGRKFCCCFYNPKPPGIQNIQTEAIVSTVNPDYSSKFSPYDYSTEGEVWTETQ